MARPLRRKRHFEIAVDPETGKEYLFESSVEEDHLSDEDSIDSSLEHKQYPKNCGCYKSAGGRCAECGRISCVDCHGRCQKCGSPLCLFHSIFIDSSNGRIRLCRRCHGQLVRQNRLRKVGRLLLSPIIEFEGDQHG